MRRPLSIFKKGLAYVLWRIEGAFDWVTVKVRRKLKLTRPPVIVPYRGFGSTRGFHIWGRVLEEFHLRTPKAGDRRWTNLRNMLRRFTTHEVPGARLKITYQHITREVETTEEGYFYLHLEDIPGLDSSKVWQGAEVELIGAPIPFTRPTRCEALVITPPEDAQFGIISDMDDTVIESFATDRWQMARTVFFNNSKTRLPFEGVASFYQALQKGGDGKGNNPLFYVSSSPWNLYDFLIDFMNVQSIPVGPLMLRDQGLDRSKLFARDHRSHKLDAIEKILAAYPHLNFILIGDSGQKDPVIYQEVIRSNPGRILACYIRDVKLPHRAQAVLKIAEELGKSSPPMVLIENTAKAAEHALKCGYICEQAVQDVSQARAEEIASVPQDASKSTSSPQEVKAEVAQELQDDSMEEKPGEEQKEEVPGMK